MCCVLGTMVVLGASRGDLGAGLGGTEESCFLPEETLEREGGWQGVPVRR